MKARPPNLYRASLALNPTFASLHCYRKYLFYSYSCSDSLGRVTSLFLSKRCFSGTTIKSRFSLADRIKQFLPEDVAEEHTTEVADWIETNPYTSLAAYEAEITKVILLIEEFKFKKASTFLLKNLPLNVVLSALINRIAPIILDGPMGQLGVVELAYSLFEEGHDALASQMLQGIDPKLEKELQFFPHVRHISSVSGVLTSIELDNYLQALTMHNFPQVLSQVQVSTWTKVRLMAQLSASDFERWLSKYSKYFDTKSITLLSTIVSSTHFKLVADWCVKSQLKEGLLPSVMKTISSVEDFRYICRKLLRRPIQNSGIATSVLATAIKLKQTYDTANICKQYADALHHPEHDALLAKALLAAAFAQRKPSNESELLGIVSSSNAELQTFLVKRVLTPVLNDDFARNAVIGRAASRLLSIHSKNLPGKVVWQLLMSLPGPITGPANMPLAKLVVKRPYIEQIRYMSLPTVSEGSIVQLLKWHIAKIMVHRRLNAVDPMVPQAKEDIQLLVVGMLLATEKHSNSAKLESALSGKPTEPSIPKSVPESMAKITKPMTATPSATEAPNSGSYTLSNLEKLGEQQSISSTILQIFEVGVLPEFSDLMVEKVAGNYDDRELSASIAFYVVAELVQQKCYTVAKQLLKAIGLNRISKSVFNNLLLNLATDQPEDSYNFVMWLVKINKVYIQPQCINQMLRILTQSSLTESQLINRFQSLRTLLRIDLNASVRAEPAADLVDALIRSAYKRGRGSQLRLQWALRVAKNAGVSDAKFNRWNETLVAMQANKQGYWSNFVHI